MDDLKADTQTPTLRVKVTKEAVVYADEAGQYDRLGESVAVQEFVRHGQDEWVRGDVHTNTIESSFNIFKRGMKGVYQHCGRQHLHRDTAEFEFRYNHRIALGFTDTMQAGAILKGAEGKRLIYRRTDARASA